MPKRKIKRKTYRKNSLSLLNIVLIVIAVGILLGFTTFIWYIKDLPRPERFTEGSIFQSTKIYDRTGEILLYEIAGDEKRTIISLNQAPDYLKQAIISTEDKNFYTHKGLDFKGIARAILYDLKLKKPTHGASTITQQMIRSYFLTQQKSFQRKTREIILSLELERRYTKDQILEWYLNIIPFGSNLYGIEAASNTFFAKSASELSLPESAVLAAMIQMPSVYSPYGNNVERLMQRKDYVLDRMTIEKYISEDQANEAKEQKIVFQPRKTSILAPHFVFYVKQYLQNKYGEDYLARKGLKVYTTLDYGIQEQAETILKDWLDQIHIYDAHNGALVSINPVTGEILAMVGSKDYFAESYPDGCSPGIDCYFDPEVNVALSLRQPGSALKPFVYSKVLQKGFNPESLVWDAKTEFNINCSEYANQEYGKYNDKCYHPSNYDMKFIGPITLRSALAQSRNLPAVKILYLSGLNDILGFLKQFGINTLTRKGDYGLSLVLGGGEVKLLEMTQAYGVFARDGVKSSLNFIKKIEDENGKIIESIKQSQVRIIPSQIAREINDILSDNDARAPMFGYNSNLNLANYDAAGKTGTTQDYNDAWLVGYTSSLVTGVWVGNNDNSAMVRKPAVSLAGPIWKRFMEAVLPEFTNNEFIEPEKRESDIPLVNGKREDHCLLHYLDQNDSQYPFWEQGVLSSLNRH